MNDEVQAFIPWDSELEEMYHSFGNEIKEPIYGYNPPLEFKRITR